MKIGSKEIGDGHPTYIIAELSINHMGDVSIAKKLIDAAAEAKADAVKFQKRSLGVIYSEDVLQNTIKYEQPFQYLIPILKKTELLLQDHIDLKAYAESLGLDYICTPFDVYSAEFINDIGVCAFKVASCDLTNKELLERIVGFKKPMILSTGMSTWEEIEQTVGYLKSVHAEFALLHCRSSYPVWPREVNLKMITKLKRFGVPVGYSGHEIGTTIPLVAASMGAAIIEKHITLDKYAEGPDHKISLLPEELKVLVRDIRIADQCMVDSSRFLLRGEILNRDVFRYRGKTKIDGAPEGVLEHTPIGKWGLITRPHDMGVMKFNPKCVEFHLTEKDLKVMPETSSYICELIVHTPEYIGEKIGDLCSGDSKIREASINICRETIAYTRSVAPRFAGTPKVIVHPGAMSMITRLKATELRRNLVKSLDVIDSDGVELLLENLPPYPWYHGGQWKGNYFIDAHEIREFCDETGYKICFDISHAALYCNSAETNLNDYLDTIKDITRHLHIADAYGMDGEGCQIGTGDIDFKGLLGLKELLEQNTWVPEIWRGHQNGYAGFIEALNKIRKVLTTWCKGDTLNTCL